MNRKICGYEDRDSVIPCQEDGTMTLCEEDEANDDDWYCAVHYSKILQTVNDAKKAIEKDPSCVTPIVLPKPRRKP